MTDTIDDRPHADKVGVQRHGAMTAATRRVELQTFLRTRRRALLPEDLGLPRGERRRIAGLRREQLASLAGVTW